MPGSVVRPRLGCMDHGSSEQEYRIVDREGRKLACRTLSNLEQAIAWVEQEVLDRNLAKWTLQVYESGAWVDRMSTRR